MENKKKYHIIKTTVYEYGCISYKTNQGKSKNIQLKVEVFDEKDAKLLQLINVDGFEPLKVIKCNGRIYMNCRHEPAHQPGDEYDIICTTVDNLNQYEIDFLFRLDKEANSLTYKIDRARTYANLSYIIVNGEIYDQVDKYDWVIDEYANETVKKLL